jgi:hypothetical protein
VELRKEIDPCIKDVLTADGLAASGQFLAWGVGLTVPGANIAIAAEIAFASGWSSITTFLVSSNCN